MCGINKIYFPGQAVSSASTSSNNHRHHHTASTIVKKMSTASAIVGFGMEEVRGPVVQRHSRPKTVGAIASSVGKDKEDEGQKQRDRSSPANTTNTTVATATDRAGDQLSKL